MRTEDHSVTKVKKPFEDGSDCTEDADSTECTVCDNLEESVSILTRGRWTDKNTDRQVLK